MGAQLGAGRIAAQRSLSKIHHWPLCQLARQATQASAWIKQDTTKAPAIIQLAKHSDLLATLRLRVRDDANRSLQDFSGRFSCISFALIQM
jgi:hypothetical protein